MRSAVATILGLMVLVGCGQTTPSPPGPTANPPDSTAAIKSTATLTIDWTVAAGCGSIGGCAYFVMIGSPDAAEAVEFELRAPGETLAPSLGVGDHTLTFNSNFVSDEVLNGQRQLGPVDATCAIDVVVAPGQDIVTVEVIFDQGACTASPPVSSDLSAEDVAAAVRLRERWGLRADEAWIRLIAKDPSATTLSGVPLTKAEEAEVARLLVPASNLRTMVHTYAESKPGYAGVWEDEDRGGMFVVQFAGDPEVHRAGLREILPPDARFDVVRVRYSRAELMALKDRIDEAWLASIGARLVSAGVDTQRNQLFVRVSSTNPFAELAILEHYDATGRMYVEMAP
jgi:hypothetical protein